MRVIINNSVYGMNDAEYEQFMNVAKKQVSMGIYAVEKDGVYELKNERYTDIADLKRVVSDYEGCGFKVYYNELTKIPKMEKGCNADNGIFVC